ncbi:hypothetical protein Tco_0206667 [Tanacetum coccineum]
MAEEAMADWLKHSIDLNDQSEVEEDYIGKVKGGGVDLGVVNSLLGEIPKDVMGESGGETLRVDGGTVWRPSQLRCFPFGHCREGSDVGFLYVCPLELVSSTKLVGKLFRRRRIRLWWWKWLRRFVLGEPRCEATSHECAHTACAFAIDIISRKIGIGVDNGFYTRSFGIP